MGYKVHPIARISNKSNPFVGFWILLLHAFSARNAPQYAISRLKSQNFWERALSLFVYTTPLAPQS